jgi:hypothetical protein
MPMRDKMPEKLEDGRVRTGNYGSDASSGPYGAFLVQGPCGESLKIISSGGDLTDDLGPGWEHVSVSTRRRCPNWIEMCFVKALFWDAEECVIQFHPPESEYVNNSPFVLHLWRHKTLEFPRPPALMVGIKAAGEIKTNSDAIALRRMALEEELRIVGGNSRP